jgi:BirA family transcriptional regulator, biotin operon repressor / biotin---[acetyl-CoA-carboxylase] ligase
MRLDPAAAAAGFRLVEHDTLASTNAKALACVEQNSASTDPLWIVAREQTAGRGRRGNTWTSPPGNLYATLLLYRPASPQHAPEVSFVAGLAVYDAISECARGLGAKLALKWPNDVLCGEAKLAGILIEGRSVEGGLAVAIGIGVNCRLHPSQTSYPATDLAEAGIDLSADDVFFALSRTMLRRLKQWRGGDGFSAVRADWLEHAAGIDGDMRVRLPDRELVGGCQGIDARGHLLLRLADGHLEAIAAGDVFPLGDGQRTGRFLTKKA